MRGGKSGGYPASRVCARLRREGHWGPGSGTKGKKLRFRKGESRGTSGENQDIHELCPGG